jgi:hypothetical protein
MMMPRRPRSPQGVYAGSSSWPPPPPKILFRFIHDADADADGVDDIDSACGLSMLLL